MKKMHVILLCAALAILTSCGEAILDPEPLAEETAPIVFNLTANHPEATKAVKTGWEDGDVIFVFFNKVFAPKHLKMSFNGSKWTCVEMNGDTPAPGCLELKNKDIGQMTAVFLPFCSDATVSANGTNFIFSKNYYTYYLTAKLDYEVEDNKISGKFIMEIPDGYVQFFIDDADATDGGYTLATDAVIPVGVASIDRDGNIVPMTKNAGDDMIGYAYGTGNNKGYLFSGNMVSSYSYKGYYFAKTKVENNPADNTRADYFVTGNTGNTENTLMSHSAVKLPANNNVYESESYGADGKWIPVGPMRFVNFYFSSLQSQPDFAWATCNYGASGPEETGTQLRFDEAKTAAVGNNYSLPSRAVINLLANKDIVKHTAIAVHGQPGFVISASRGFIFLPWTSINPISCDYWSGEEDNNTGNAWYFSFAGTSVEGADYMYSQGKEAKLAVRMVL